MKIKIQANHLCRFILLMFFSVTGTVYGQLTGIKTIPGNYATISAAVSALNTQGVGSGGVTFNVSAGYTETLSARIAMTGTGTLANPIVFQKSGSGANPKITAYAGTATPSSATPDGIWSFQGSDYVTIDGIDLYDPNAANPATMEYGYGLFRNTAYDGAQYNTIRNCTITMNRVNNASGTSPMVDGSVCILVINSTPAAATSAFAPFAPSGTNSYNRFYSNLLQNCNYGIVLTGSIAATPFDLGDNGNDAGGSALSTGNSILNYGGGSNSVSSAGVRAINQWAVNISYNTINNNNGSGISPKGNLYGINAESGLSGNADINFNTVTLKASSGAGDVTGITNGIGATAASNTVNLNNNVVTNCTCPGNFTGIYNSADAATVNVNNNIVSYVTQTSVSGSVTGINCLGTNLTMGNNLVSHLTVTGTATGSNYHWIYGISCVAPTSWCHDNTMEYLTLNGQAFAMVVTGISGGNGSAPNETCTNNIIKEITCTSAMTSFQLTAFNFGTTGTKTIQYNQVYNVVAGSSQNFFTGIGGKGQISDNLIHDIQFQLSTNGSMTGISLTSDGTVSHNQVYGLSVTSGTTGPITGISATNATTGTICKNIITNLSGANTGTIVDGIDLSGGTKNVYNNFIGDLRAPNSPSATAIAGINITASGSYNIYNNSIFLNANSTGATFGTSGIYVNTAGTLDLRNNNVVNTSIPNGGAYTCACRRSSTTLPLIPIFRITIIFMQEPQGCTGLSITTEPILTRHLLHIKPGLPPGMLPLSQKTLRLSILQPSLLTCIFLRACPHNAKAMVRGSPHLLQLPMIMTETSARESLVIPEPVSDRISGPMKGISS